MSEYQPAFRRNYELWAAGMWLLFAGMAWLVSLYSLLPSVFFYWMMGICGLMSLLRAKPGVSLYLQKRGLRGRSLSIISLQALMQLLQKTPEGWWLGYGFVWENCHAQKAFEMTQQESVVETTPRQQAVQLGQAWIHGLERQECSQYLPLSHAEGHTLILGTTGSGKTRLFDLLISQAILRGEAVIIIDPKGDRALWQNAQRCCRAE